MPDIAQVRNPRLVRALRDSLIKSGVTVSEGVEVRGLHNENGRVTGVLTDQGTVQAGAVVVAGGAWSAALLKTVGIDLPMAPVRGQMLLFRTAPGLLTRMVMRHYRYLIPRRDGRILAGSTLEQVGFDKTTTHRAAEKLQSAALDLVPALENCPIEHQWTGLRPGNPTGVPYIGAHPTIGGNSRLHRPLPEWRGAGAGIGTPAGGPGLGQAARSRSGAVCITRNNLMEIKWIDLAGGLCRNPGLYCVHGRHDQKLAVEQVRGDKPAGAA